MTSDMDLRKQKKEIVVAQEKLPERMAGGEELKISWWTTWKEFFVVIQRR